MWFILLNQKAHLRQDRLSFLNRFAGWNELLLMADQGKVFSSCGTIAG